MFVRAANTQASSPFTAYTMLLLSVPTLSAAWSSIRACWVSCLSALLCSALSTPPPGHLQGCHTPPPPLHPRSPAVCSSPTPPCVWPWATPHTPSGLQLNADRPDHKLPYRGAWLWIGPEMIHLMELPNPDPAGVYACVQLAVCCAAVDRPMPQHLQAVYRSSVCHHGSVFCTAAVVANTAPAKPSHALHRVACRAPWVPCPVVSLPFPTLTLTPTPSTPCFPLPGPTHVMDTQTQASGLSMGAATGTFASALPTWRLWPPSWTARAYHSHAA